MNDDRERIFAAIRRGIKSAPKSNAARDARTPLKSPLPADFDVRFRKFEAELKVLGGEGHVIDDRPAVSRFLNEHIPGDASVFIYDEVREKYKDVYSELTRTRTGKSSSDFAAGYDKRDVSIFDSAILPCAACVAETGTVVLRNDMRLPAALATRLFILTDQRQMIGSLDELFTDKFRDSGGSNLFLITGPSRTADIEKELVTGVHGPKQVFVIFCQE